MFAHHKWALGRENSMPQLGAPLWLLFWLTPKLLSFRRPEETHQSLKAIRFV